MNKVFGDSAETEAADEQLGSVRNVGHRFRRRFAKAGVAKGGSGEAPPVEVTADAVTRKAPPMEITAAATATRAVFQGTVGRVEGRREAGRGNSLASRPSDDESSEQAPRPGGTGWSSHYRVCYPTSFSSFYSSFFFSWFVLIFDWYG